MEKFRLSEDIDPNKIFIINRSELEGRIDPNFYKTVNKKIVNKIKKNNFYTIKDIVRFSSETWDQKSIFDSEFPYIEISNIDLSDGTIKDVKLIGVKEAPSRAKMIVRKNDIIISTTRPTRGAISIQKNSSIQIASTGFSVIREINEKLFLREALFHILRLSFVSIQMGQRSSGGNYPAITQEELGRIVIPAISLSIQEKINNIYNKAYTKKQQKETEAQRLLDSIDDYLLGELGITLPKEEEHLPQNTDKNNSYNLDNDNPLVKKGRLFLTNLSEVTGKRIDPKGYDIKTKLLKSSIDNINSKKFIVQPLKSFIIQSIAGNWGIDENEEIEENEEYQKCLVIRATEFDNQYNLNLDNSRVKYRLINKSILSKIDLKENDLLIEKSGGSPDQPVGRIAIITQNIIKNNILCYSNFIHKIRVDNKKINPEYLFCFLKMMHNIRLTEAMQSQTNGIRNLIMNSYLNQNIVIPISENGKIDIQKQTEIANRITAIREEAKKLQLEAFDTLEIAKREIEQMILGN